MNTTVPKPPTKGSPATPKKGAAQPPSKGVTAHLDGVTVDPSHAGGGATTVAREVPVADPMVMTYLEVSSTAFARIHLGLNKQAETWHQRTQDAMKSTTATISQNEQGVRLYVKDRETMHQDIMFLKNRKQELEKQISSSKELFSTSVKESEHAHLVTVTKMSAQIDSLSRDAAEGVAWDSVRLTLLRELLQLQTKISETRKAHDAEFQHQREEQEKEKRHLRDVLVRRLRRLRDTMSTTTEDDTDGTDGSSLQPLLSSSSGGAGVGAVVPTAKLNEKLARAVTMYERESKSVADSIVSLADACKQAEEQVLHQRNHNEKLVLRNASHIKTTTLLTQQLDELRRKYDSVCSQQSILEVDRKKAVRETIQAQADIVHDLNGELDFAMTEYDDARRRLSALRRELSNQESSLDAGVRFLVSIVTQHDGDAAVASRADPVVTGEGGQRHQPDDDHHRRGVGLPTLGLKTRKEVATFLSSVLLGG